MFESVHFSAPVPMNLADARIGLEDWLEHRVRHRRWRYGPFRVAKRMWLFTPRRKGDSGAKGDPLPGLLWCNGFPVRVRLELAEWSTTTASVGLFPHRLGDVVQTSSYRVIAHECVQSVAYSISHGCTDSTARRSLDSPSPITRKLSKKCSLPVGHRKVA
jgi:hypothetical protein